MTSVRIFLVLTFWLLCHTLVFGHGPSYYVIHSQLKMKDGHTEKGYFYFGSEDPLITKNGNGSYYYYSSRTRKGMLLHPIDSTPHGVRPARIDDHFNQEILYRMQDSLRLFANIRLVNLTPPQEEDASTPPMAALLGRPSKFAITDIKSISIESIREILTIARTNLSLEDGSWLKPRILSTHYIGIREICRVDAVAFRNLSSTAQALVNELRELCNNYSKIVDSAGYATYISRERALIEKLRKEQVIIIAECSC